MTIVTVVSCVCARTSSVTRGTC